MKNERLLKRLVDKPLSRNETEFFVDRGEELSALQKILKYYAFGIFGLCGRTGSGKTTLLNMLTEETQKIVRISIIYRDNSDAILYNLLYSLAEHFIKDDSKEIQKISQNVKEWLFEEVSIVRGFSLGLSMMASADLKSSKAHAPRFNVFKAHDYLQKMLDAAKKHYGKVSLLIDELDKEKKEDVIKILDSLKLELQQEDVLTIVTLPQSIYKEYIHDRLRMNGFGNLENIIKDVVFIRDLENHHGKEMLIKRFSESLDWFEDLSILDMLADFSDGNPRDAIWIAQKVVLENISKNQLTVKDAIQSIQKISKELIRNISLTDLQTKALKILRGLTGSREQFLIKLVENGFARTTAYSIFDKFLEIGFIVPKESGFKFSGKLSFVEEL